MAKKRKSVKKDKKKKSFPEYIGRVQMTRDRYAFIVIEGEDDDVFVKESNTKGALNGDIVRVAVTKEKTDKSRKEGKVVEIIERSQKPFVGILHVVGKQAWVLMESRFMPYDIVIPITEDDATRFRKHKPKTKQSLAESRDETGFLRPLGAGDFSVVGVRETLEDGSSRELEVRSGMKIAALVDGWARGETTPFGHLVDVLGVPGDNDTEMHAILAEYGLPYRFEPQVANAAESISEEITEKDIAERKDFRKTLTFTIDPVDAKDFDDAISLKKLENGNYEVGVHIADVTHYVKPGSLVDEEAKSRGTSVYLVDRTVPMLPEKLSNKLCSLRPNEDKLTFSAVFEMTPLAKVVDQWFGRTIIKSNYRFAYETVQQIIDAGEEAMKTKLYGGTDGNFGEMTPAMMGGGVTEGCLIPDDCKEAVLILNELALKLRQKRFANGAISFERPEMKVLVDEQGRPVDVYQKESTEANWLIEELMLLANRTVAEFVATGCKGVREKGAPYKVGKSKAKTFVYRVHDEPNLDKLENLKLFISNFGYKMGETNSGRQISRELNTLFKKAKDKPEYNAIELMSLRTMAKARYSTDNLGHYGLAFKYYTHFTSPIRRFPDMLVHRLLSRYLEGGESVKQDVYEKMCKYTSEREIIAADAERASIKYKLVEFMQDKVGYEFDGNISGLTEWGIYVEIATTKIEGMVALRDIRSDYFEFDEERYRIVGKRTKVVYSLGDPVRIRVKRANLEQKLIDYELIETGYEDRIRERIDYEYGRGTSFVKGEDGSFDNITVGINKATRKAKIRKARKESKK